MNTPLSKREYAKAGIERNVRFLSCPICHKKLRFVQNSLLCPQGHCFDMDKRGGILLVGDYGKRRDKIYSASLFSGRRRFIQAGFYNLLHEYIAETIKRFNLDGDALFLDLGCGEGTHWHLINEQFGFSCNCIGIDLAGDAIRLAGDYLQYACLPIQADISNLPLADDSCGCTLNILSPYNAREIKRVLKKDGLIIKAVPTKKYLTELRSAFGLDEYENDEDVEACFANNFNIISKHNITATLPLNGQTRIDLLNMTPLLANIPDTERNKSIESITIDLNCLLGQNKL